MLGSFTVANEVEACTVAADRVGFVTFLSPVQHESVSCGPDTIRQGRTKEAYLWRQVKQPVRWRVVPDFLLMWRLTNVLLSAGAGEVEELEVEVMFLPGFGMTQTPAGSTCLHS